MSEPIDVGETCPLLYREDERSPGSPYLLIPSPRGHRLEPLVITQSRSLPPIHVIVHESGPAAALLPLPWGERNCS